MQERPQSLLNKGDNIMKRRSRWFLVATAAIALASSLSSLPYLAALTSAPASASYPTQGLTLAAAPMANTSWQGMLMAGRW